MKETHNPRRHQSLSPGGVSFELIQGGKDHTNESAYPEFIQQYLEIKKQVPNAILFFQMGDFYEMFFGDAEKVSRIIGCTLTSRKHQNSQYIPMCGVGVHNARNAINQLKKANCRVAVCDQINSASVSLARVERKEVRFLYPEKTVTNK